MLIRFTIILCLIAASLFCSGQKIYDVFNNTYVEYSRPTMDTTFKYKLQTLSVHLTWLEIETDGVKKGIAPAVKKLIHSYLNQEKMLYPLMEEANARKDFFLKAVSQDGYMSSINLNNLNKINIQYPSLVEIRTLPLSLVNGVLHFEIDFAFRTARPSSGGLVSPSSAFSFESDFAITHYYTIDLNSKKINRFDPALKDSELNALKEYCLEKIQEEYAVITKKMSLFDLYRFQGSIEKYGYAASFNEKSKQILQSEFLTNIRWEEIKLHWFYWGVIAGFEEFSASTELNSGGVFNVFIDLEDAKKILSQNPSFAFIKNLKLNPSGIINSRGTPDAFENKKLLMRNEFETTVWINGVDTKGLEIERVEFYESQLRPKALSNTKLFRYDSAGNLARFEAIDSRGQSLSLSTFLYDENGLLKYEFEHDTDNKKPEKITSYFYDSIGNIKMKFKDEGTETKKIHYACNGNFSYNFYLGLFDGKLPSVTAYEVIDQNTQTEASRNSMKGESYFERYFLMNNNGQPSESYSNDDRQAEFFDYDDQNRIIKRINIYDRKITLLQEFQYQSENKIPTVETVTTYSSDGLVNVRTIEYKYIK